MSASRHPVQFEATGGGLELTNAILLYQGNGLRVDHHDRAPGKNGAAFASMHPVEHGDGQPVIGAGVPLTRAHLRQWTEALDKVQAPEILPENVLIAHPDMLAWWLPAQVRPAYFNLTRPGKRITALAQRTTLPMPYPAHLLVATRANLGVYALPENCRPTAATIVLHSPVLNVFIDGALCWGNIAKPKALTIASMADYERAVFDSWSTHPNAGQEGTVNGKGGLVQLWNQLAARGAKRFPVERLKSFYPAASRPADAAPITLGQLIGRITR